MINIRNKVFETNSSSTHSVVILKKADWEAVKNGELFIDVFSAEKHELYPRLVTENLVLAEAREEYLEEERDSLRGKDCHRDFHDGHYVSWEEIMKRCNGDYNGYDLNLFGWAGERYINPKSKVWHSYTEKELENGNIHIEIDHFFG